MTRAFNLSFELWFMLLLQYVQLQAIKDSNAFTTRQQHQAARASTAVLYIIQVSFHSVGV
jgi:hypothetical protein